MTDATLDKVPTETLAGLTMAEHVERRTRRMRALLVSPALVIIGGFGVLPLSIIVVYSFMEPGEYAGVVWRFSLEAWVNLFLQRDIFDDTLGLNDAHIAIFTRSVSLAVITTVLTLVFGYPTAYFIATRPPRQRNILLFLITLPFWTNLLIRSFALLLIIRDEGVVNHWLLSLGVLEGSERIVILYTDWAVGLGLVYAYLPYMVMPLYASMEKLDFRLIEAGYDLYAGRLQVLRRIIIPLTKPGIVAGCILVFIPAIGAYVTPQLMGGGKKLMLGNLIANQFGVSRNWPLGSAISLFLMALVMVALILYVRNASRQNAHG